MAKPATTDTPSPSLPIKGIRDGLLVSAGHVPAANLASEVGAALEAQRDFFAGSRIAIDVGSRRLSRAQLGALLREMEKLELELWAELSSVTATRDVARELGLATRVPGSHTDLERWPSWTRRRRRRRGNRWPTRCWYRRRFAPGARFTLMVTWSCSGT